MNSHILRDRGKAIQSGEVREEEQCCNRKNVKVDRV